MRSLGVTLVELLIALAILSIVLTPLVVGMTNSLKASSNAEVAGKVKSAAVRLLEQKTAEVFDTYTYNSSSSDSGNNSNYYFIDYLYKCPSVVSVPSGVRTGQNPQLLSSLNCTGNTAASSSNDFVATTWAVAGETGQNGAGIVKITVTATHTRLPTMTLVNFVSCYDITHNPNTNAPITCPPATWTGR